MSKNYKFSKYMSIGAMDAYEDEKFLIDCFVDTGELNQLINTSASQCIILARTGAGKSALLEKIKNREENIISLEPNELALNYIANSNIIQFFNSLGIKLDLFYQLLWKHVLVVELIQKKYDIKSEKERKSFIDRISNMFVNDKNKEEAVEYLLEWGNKFWLETDKRIKELTTKMEDELSASADFSGLGIPLTATGTEKLSKEQREEITHRAQNVVNKVQISKLNRIIQLLADDIFTNEQQKFYILIDKLDDDWVDDNLRYRLIRALIETVKTFKKIGPVKIIVALRCDLLQRVFEETRDSGFQEEKYDDLILRLKWKPEELHTLLDQRISLLIREQYTGKTVAFNNIFACKPNGYKPIDYILNRTFMRPRDAISFVNICLEEADGKTEITSEVIRVAEKKYSQKRFSAICHEWYGTYPLLNEYFKIVKNKKNGFKHSDISKDDVEEFALELSVSEQGNSDGDPIKQSAKKLFEGTQETHASLKNKILKILYNIGMLGVKKASFSTVSWSYNEEPSITESEIKNATTFEIHPMLHSALGINDTYIKIKKNHHG